MSMPSTLVALAVTHPDVATFLAGTDAACVDVWPAMDESASNPSTWFDCASGAMSVSLPSFAGAVAAGEGEGDAAIEGVGDVWAAAGGDVWAGPGAGDVTGAGEGEGEDDATTASEAKVAGPSTSACMSLLALPPSGASDMGVSSFLSDAAVFSSLSSVTPSTSNTNTWAPEAPAAAPGLRMGGAGRGVAWACAR